jgi:hypothetical protein
MSLEFKKNYIKKSKNLKKKRTLYNAHRARKVAYDIINKYKKKKKIGTKREVREGEKVL